MGAAGAARLSFEFFPPRSQDAMVRLRDTWHALAPLAPEFFSVTYGAGGSTRDRTIETVTAIAASGHEAAPHLSCIGSTRAETAQQLEVYAGMGVQRIVALRGDLPSGTADAGELRYASELVELIRARTGARFRIEVACYPEVHPQARSAHEDVARFRDKVQAGADAAITQFFFNADAYLRFRDEAAAHGVTVPIYPGIMPIVNFAQLARFADACGAEIPRWLRLRMHAYADDAASIRSLGLDVVTDLCARLLAQQAPGLHFYTMNQSALALEICARLRSSASAPRAGS